MSKSGGETGNPIGIGSNYGFSGSGELDNGWTVDLSIAHTNAGAYSNANVTIGVPSIGDIRIDQGTSGTGIQRYDDITPTVWEEADGTGLTAGINKIMGTSAGGTVEVTPSALTPDGVTMHIAFSADSDSGNTSDKNTGGSSGLLGSGWDLTVEASGDALGYDGLTVYAGVSQVEAFQNAGTQSGDVKERVIGAKYAAGAFTVGYQKTNEDTGATGTTDYDNIAYGITFNVNDDLSIGYGHVESDNGTTTAEADSLQVAYTMGGASWRIAEVNVDNATYSTASSADQDATVISLGLAF
jgi:outer membrane protein OmpU